MTTSKSPSCSLLGGQVNEAVSRMSHHVIDRFMCRISYCHWFAGTGVIVPGIAKTDVVTGLLFRLPLCALAWWFVCFIAASSKSGDVGDPWNVFPKRNSLFRIAETRRFYSLQQRFQTQQSRLNPHFSVPATFCVAPSATFCVAPLPPFVLPLLCCLPPFVLPRFALSQLEQMKCRTVAATFRALATKFDATTARKTAVVCFSQLEESLDNDELHRAAEIVVAVFPALSPPDLAVSIDRITEILRTTSNDYTVLSTCTIIDAIATRLDHRATKQLWSELHTILESSDDGTWSIPSVATSIQSIRPNLDLAQRARTVDTLLDVLQRHWSDQVSATSFQFLADRSPQEQNENSRVTMAMLLDFVSSNDHYYASEGGTLDYVDGTRFVAMGINEPKSIAYLLQHPGCIDRPREFLLQRFEELVFHNGERVFLPLPKNEVVSGPTIDAARLAEETVAAAKPELPSRRFHTIHDAADWIQHNWPDFDLEATHPVTWRGER